MEGTEEIFDLPLPPGVASDPPLGLTLILTMGVFAAVTWGLMALFRDRSQPPPLRPHEPDVD